MKPMKLAAAVLLVAGLALLIFGIYQFVEFRQSPGGKLASAGNQIISTLGGSSKVAGGYTKPVIFMVLGVVSGAAGFFLSKKR